MIIIPDSIVTPPNKTLVRSLADARPAQLNRYRKEKEMTWSEKLPNKCDYCGLRVRYDFRSSEESSSNDTVFGELRRLHDKKLIKPYYRRVVSDSNVNSGSTEFCAVSKEAWHNNEKPCKYWTLRIEGGTVADYLSLYSNSKSLSAAWWMGIGAIGATLLMGLGAIFATYSATGATLSG